MIIFFFGKALDVFAVILVCAKKEAHRMK